MSLTGKSTNQGGNLGPIISEEKFKTEIRNSIETLLGQWGGEPPKVHPLQTRQEHYLGFDDLFEWGSLRLDLPSPSPPQSCITLKSPLIIQYKISTSEQDDFVYSIPLDQFIQLSAYAYFGVSTYYVLAKVRTPQELEAAQHDLFRIAYWVEPKEFNLNSFAYEEYLLHVDPVSGRWFTSPVEAKLLSVPYDPDPEKLRTRLENALVEFVPRRLSQERLSSLELIQGAYEIVRLTCSNDNPQGHIKHWRSYEIREGQ